MRRAYEGFCHISTRTMNIKNIGFKLHPDHGSIQRLNQRRKISLPALQQLKVLSSLQCAHDA